MKLIKLSLVAIMTIGTMAYAGDSIGESFKNGKFNGEFRFVYTGGSDSDAAGTFPAGNANVGSIAVEMNYVTDDYNGFKLGLGFQAGHDLEFHDEDGSSEDDARNSVSASHLHNIFLQYSFLKSNLKVGRQTIKLPMLMNSGAFALEDSFDAAVLTINEIPSTTLKLIYIQEWNKRYGSDASASPVQQDVHYSDGLYSLYVKNKSIENLTIDAQYITTNEKDTNGDAPILVKGGYDQFFVRSNYKLPISFPLSLGLTYGGVSYDAPTQDDTSFYGLKLGTAFSGVKLDFAYTSMNDDNNFPGTLGHVPDTIFYTSMLTNQSLFAGVDAYSLQAIYNFGVKKLSTRFKIAHFTQSDEGMSNSPVYGKLDGADEFNVDIRYAFSGALKGVGTRLWAGYGQYDEDVAENDFTYARFYLKYNF